MNNKNRIEEFFTRIQQELDTCMNFWFQYSHDTQFGGFFNCLGRDGKVYDDLKYGWLQGRQVWMYARLYNEVERFQKEEVLKNAIQGAEFLRKHVKDPVTNRCTFSLTRTGKPVKIQRTVFTEVFYVLAMSEVFRATNNGIYKDEALHMMDRIVFWVRKDDSELNRPHLSGMTATNTLAVPMMMLCLVDQLLTMDQSLADGFVEVSKWSVQKILDHVQRDGKAVLENIFPNGKEKPGCEGRLMNPGHSIEAGWFLLQHARNSDHQLKTTAIKQFIAGQFQAGWDREYGGLFYFLDVDGLPPIQLEWNMKLWWPHNEALVGLLMAYKETGNAEYLDKFAKVFDYTFSHFSDPEHGEWYGYLNREGKINMDFKGGPFKGCFHVPRCLMMCEKMLAEIMNA